VKFNKAFVTYKFCFFICSITCLQFQNNHYLWPCGFSPEKPPDTIWTWHLLFTAHLCIKFLRSLLKLYRLFCNLSPTRWFHKIASIF
jgi:hypothetical protein